MKALFFMIIFAVSLSGAELKVVVFHPLLGDLVRQIGGDRVEVVDVVGEKGDPHNFAPGPKDWAQAKGAKLYLLSGKGLESYVNAVRDMAVGAKVLEGGSSLPTLHSEVLCEHGGHTHHHEHEDPHWWHSLDCWRRAARVVGQELEGIDPAGAEHYRAGVRELRKSFSNLDLWVKAELALIPEDKRVLATAHQAFNYFCHDYGFRALAVQGINREQAPSAKFVAEVVATLEKEKVAAIFPELMSNPKMLHTLAKDTGIRIGSALDASGGDSIENMFRGNVEKIVDVLASKKEVK